MRTPPLAAKFAAALTLTLAALTVVSCDQHVDDDSDDVAFRGDVEEWAVVHWGNPPAVIYTKLFADIVTTCSNVHKPKWIVSLSGHSVDQATAKMVVGIGGSAYVPMSFWDCLKAKWIENDAVQLDPNDP